MKLPLPTTLKVRAAGTRQDARLKNALVDKRRRIVKRPILDGAFTPVPLGPGLGLYVRNGTDIIAITGNTLTTNPAPLTKKLRYSVQPSRSSIDTAVSPSVTLEAVSLLGSLSSTFASTVTIALADNPTGATLSGTVTTNAIAGVATFNNLKISRSGEGFQLMATATNLSSKVSAKFDIPTRLNFTVQPADKPPNTTLDPVEVTAQDTAGNADTQYTGDVTLATYSGGPGLDGTLTATAVAGIASFANLSFTTTGTFSLQVTGTKVTNAYPPAEGISNTFVIGNTTHTLTAIQFVLNSYGMSLPSGSISPTTLNTKIIGELLSDLGPDFFSRTVVTLKGAVAQSFFDHVTINSRTLYTSSLYASGSFGVSAGSSQWIWYDLTFDTARELVTGAGSFGVTFA